MRIPKDKLSISPHNISDTAWYYEDEKSIEIIVYQTSANPRHIKIPYFRLAEILKKAVK